MIYKSLTVHTSGKTSEPIPRIQINDDWLPKMGFVNNALVQVLPGSDGLTIRLCNEGIRSYSELYESTEKEGGTLLRIFLSNTRSTKGPTFSVSGKYILASGLNIGDRIAVRCEAGLIRIRKLDDDIRFMNIGKRQDKPTDASTPSVSFSASWLTDFGFTPDTLVTLDSKPGEVVLTTLDSSTSYMDACKLARKGKMRLLKVCERFGSPKINVSGLFVERAGFEIGEMVIVLCSEGTIKLQKFDESRLGF